jgi:hypothetical protein
MDVPERYGASGWQREVEIPSALPRPLTKGPQKVSRFCKSCSRSPLCVLNVFSKMSLRIASCDDSVAGVEASDDSEHDSVNTKVPILGEMVGEKEHGWRGQMVLSQYDWHAD